jgi:CRISPR-associated protein Csm5
MADTMKAKITILSPVHIGSGKGEIKADDDFVSDNSFIYVIDHDKMFEQAGEASWQGNNIDVRISNILKPNQYKACSHYSLNRTDGNVRRIIEQIKNAHYRPYIPGSSIKGAIRTALAYAMAKGNVAEISIDNMGYNPRTAGKSLESKLFGADPNRDMMRALQVSDTQGAENSLALRSVVLYTLRQEGLEAKDRNQFLFHTEVIPEGGELEFTIKLDSHLLRDDISKKLGFDVRKQWLQEFPKHCNTFAEKLISSERTFYNKHKLFSVRDFYNNLRGQIGQIDKEKQFFLQMSGGTGWTAKTVGTAMDKETYWDVVDRFKLDKGKDADIFPKTRKLVERGNLAEMPLGWVRVDLM